MGCLGFSSLAEVGVYITCVLLGISMLMPINALTSAPRYMVDYYKYVTRNPDAEPNSPLFWANILTFYNLVSVVTQIICGPTVLIPCVRKLSLTVRFVLAIFMMMVEVFVVLVMPTGGTSQVGAIVSFLIVTVAAGAGKAYLEATCYALAGPMPPKFMSAVMFGCGFSGVIASILQCIVKASMPNTYDSTLQQAYIYFSLALGFMGAALVASVLLRYNSFAQQYVGEYRQLKKKHDDAGGAVAEPIEHAPLTEDPRPISAGQCYSNNSEMSDVTGDVVLDAPRAGKELQQPGEEGDHNVEEVRAVQGSLQAEMVDEEALDQHNMTTAEQLQHTRVWPIVKLIYPMQIACFCVFFVSLFIFPSLIIAIDRDSNWFATIAILLYNCGDATGRLSSSFKVLWPSRRVLLIASLCRFLFLPLIFLCIYGYIPGHAPPYVFMTFVGLTNGFCGATSMVFGATTPGLKTDGQRAMAGQLMGISLLAGASAASLLALLVVLFLP